MIALIITIIVLLIVASISIAILIGDNGILMQANNAKIQTTIGEEKEAIALAYNGARLETKGESVTADLLNDQFSQNGTKAKATATGEETIRIDFETGRSYTVNAYGKIADDKEEIVKYLSVGDYVDYDPTVITKDKKTSVAENKLTYSSPVGAAKEHGNGDRVQNFKATADTKWRVLSIENGIVELIADDVIKTSDNANFRLRGAIGYLYAERELNEVCKIFGYGYGADSTKGGTYTIGGPLDTPTVEKIAETGARSITIEDINKKAGIVTEDDCKTLNSNYGSTTNPTSNVNYPTVNGNSTTGKSEVAGAKNLKYTLYNYAKTRIENTDIQNILFKENYWLASRCIETISESISFYVRMEYGGNVHAHNLCYGYGIYDLDENTGANCAVRPIVTLKSNVIDLSTNYSEEGAWKLK